MDQNCRQIIEDPDDLDVEVAEQKTGKTRQSRPPRSVLYYLKGYESTISLTPCQLPPRSRILQVKFRFVQSDPSCPLNPSVAIGLGSSSRQ